MNNDMFAGLGDLMATPLDKQENKVSHDVKTLDDNHREIADKMTTNFDEHKPYVEKALPYPFLEVKGPRTKFEIEHLRRKSITETSVPLMIHIQGKYSKIGDVDMNFNNIVDLLSIANYELVWHQSEEEALTVDTSLIVTLLLT